MSGDPSCADLNFGCVAAEASVPWLKARVDDLRSSGTHAILIIDERATDLHEAALRSGMTAAGSTPAMVWDHGAAPAPSDRYPVRRATRDDMPGVADLIAEANGLPLEAASALMPGAAVETTDFWIAEDDGRIVGAAMSAVCGDHAGIYAMATPERLQRQGIGRAVLDTALATHVEEGVTAFTLEATEAGQRLYEQLGFVTFARPAVFLLGESTQFPDAARTPPSSARAAANLPSRAPDLR